MVTSSKFWNYLPGHQEVYGNSIELYIQLLIMNRYTPHTGGGVGDKFDMDDG